MLKNIAKLDWVMVGTALLLTAMGLVSLYSSSIGRQDFTNFQKQLVFAGVGLFLMFLISFSNWRILKNNSYLILILYAIGLVALAGLFLFAPETRGTRGWYKIWYISIDPVEYMKLAALILMAKYFSARHVEMYHIRHIVLSGLYFAVPIALIALQPNLGSAFVLLTLWISMLLVSGIKIRHFLFIVALGMLIFVFGWSFLLADYQKARIFAFLEPELDPLGIGWSQLQSKIAIGNGGFWGQGVGEGIQTQYFFLSEPQTDFIFAALAEELGFIGVFALFCLFLALILRVIRVGIRAESNFPRLFTTGFATLLIVQFFLNVGMNLGLLPIVGLPLPLVSYGGSSLIAAYIGLGIIQSMRLNSGQFLQS